MKSKGNLMSGVRGDVIVNVKSFWALFDGGGRDSTISKERRGVE